MVNIDWMVGRLVELVQYSDAAARGGGGGENGRAEVVFCHYLTATESEHYSSRLDAAQRFGVQPCVSFQCVVQGGAVFRECRRIEYYKIVSIAC